MVQQQFIIAELSQDGEEESEAGEDRDAKELPRLTEESQILHHSSSLQLQRGTGRSNQSSVVKEMMRMIRDEDNELVAGSTSKANNNDCLQRTESFSRQMR